MVPAPRTSCTRPGGGPVVCVSFICMCMLCVCTYMCVYVCGVCPGVAHGRSLQTSYMCEALEGEEEEEVPLFQEDNVGQRGGLGGVNSVVQAHVASDNGLKHGNHLDLIQALVLKAQAGLPLYLGTEFWIHPWKPYKWEPRLQCWLLPSQPCVCSPAGPHLTPAARHPCAAWEAMEALSEELACELKFK